MAGSRTKGDEYAGNGRVPRLARWLRDQVADAASVTLETEEDDGTFTQRSRWVPAPRLVPARIAAEAYEYVLQSVEEQQRTCVAEIVVMDAHGTRLAQRKITIESHDQPQLRGDGSMRDLVVQSQVHLQRVMDLFTKNQIATFQVLHKQAESNAAYVDELRRVVRRLDVENSKLRDQLVSAVNAIEGDGDDGTGAQLIGLLKEAIASGGKTQLAEQLKPFSPQLQMLAQVLAGHESPPPSG